MTPPLTRRDAVADTWHGVSVPDPFRWLEAGEQPEVQEWVHAQNAYTRTALDARPDRGRWHERLVALMHLPVVQAVETAGDWLVLLERGVGEQQASLLARAVADPSHSVLLCSPAVGAADGAIAIDWFHTSPDGSMVAYGVSEGGTEDLVLRVVRTSDAAHLPLEIPGTRACSIGWEPDSSGFFYTRYPDGDEYHRTVYHHTIGTHWPDDPVVWAEHPNPQAWPNVTTSPCGRFVLVSVMVGWSRVDQHLLVRSSGWWVSLITGVEAVSSFVFAHGAGGTVLVGSTTLDAPLGRLVSVDLTEMTEISEIAEITGPETQHGAQIQPSAWLTIVPERNVVLGSPVACGDSVLVTTSAAAVDSIERWTLAGAGPQLIEIPALSTVVALCAHDGANAAGPAFAIVTGFGSPPAVWRIDGATASLVHPAASGGELPDLVVTHEHYPSLDGTLIGVFLIHRSDVTPDARTATILNGYGGFAISESPMWSPTIAAWCGAGGVYAVAGLRGGYEHGEQWHAAGRRANKQNVFDDFHAAADWLVDTGRTSRDRLAIAGGSNGGLLVGVALTQRPDLCRAVWCAVPLLDMVRFPRFLIAKLWTSEYGDPDIPEEFAWVHAYSPYHHVVDGQRYPSVLLTTAEGDSRVDPLHARKMAALLQSAAEHQHERPVFLHQEGRAGHGVGKPVGKRAEESADVLAFLSWQLGSAERDV